MLEKVKLLSAGIKNLAEDTKNQKQIIQQIIKELEVYEEIYEYQTRATKIRQEIAKIAETAINFEKTLQDYFHPFQSLIDEVVKVDENFYATVGDIKNLADNILQSQLNLFSHEEAETISENLLNFMVASYEKKERLKDAFIESQLLDWQAHIFDLSDDTISLEKAIYLISNYLSDEIADQKNILGIAEENIIDIKSLPIVEERDIKVLNNKDIIFTKEFKSSNSISYSELQNLLTQQMWKEADLETTKLMLQVMGKNYWNEVYKEDIDNFSCESFQTIDQFWKQYSHGYFGFSVQQAIWNEIGGQIDYETQKILGDRLGWRKEGNWLDYDQLTFKLSSTTPMGHLPAKWLHYDQYNFELYPNSLAEPISMGAWRVESWLVWQMHLFFSRVKVCNGTSP
ncbi:GUN4 domain-containing protein [Nostoc sp. KVJ3]|uniref:GUN4 domain-containing protein n=1 Tax=Nostoc sp. KVJ3 TaxID=457945 RepID=UPI002238F5BD|nr:GUN4 domain-containing protein [Nostoc sp. KVJ3]